MDVLNPNYLNYMEQIQKNRKDIEKLYDQELSDITQLNFKENDVNGLQYANGKAIFQGKSTIIRDANTENLEVDSKVELKISSGDTDIVIGAGEDSSTLEIHLDNETKLALDFAESERQKSTTDGAVVHEKDIEPILIYDIDTKNTISGTAYTSGINYGITINYDFTPYKKLKIYAYRPQNGPFTYEINLEQKDNSQNVYSGSGICYSYQEADNYFAYSSASVSENKQQLKIIKCGYTLDFFTTPTLSTTCYIYRLEGVK